VTPAPHASPPKATEIRCFPKHRISETAPGASLPRARNGGIRHGVPAAGWQGGRVNRFPVPRRPVTPAGPARRPSKQPKSDVFRNIGFLSPPLARLSGAQGTAAYAIGGTRCRVAGWQSKPLPTPLSSRDARRPAHPLLSSSLLFNGGHMHGQWDSERAGG
jgi:hypothetical protein